MLAQKAPEWVGRCRLGLCCPAQGLQVEVTCQADCLAVHFNLEAFTRAAQAQLAPVAPSHPTPTPISSHTPVLSIVTSMTSAVDTGLVLLKLEKPRSACKAAGIMAGMHSQGTSLTAVMSCGVVYVIHNGLFLPRQLQTGETYADR